MSDVGCRQTSAGAPPNRRARAAGRPRVRASCATGSSRSRSRPARRSTRTARARAGDGPHAGARGDQAARAREPGDRLPAPRHVRLGDQHHRPRRHLRRAHRSSRATPRTAPPSGSPPAQRARARAQLLDELRASRGQRRRRGADGARRARAPLHLPLQRQPVPGGDARPLLQPVAADLVPGARPAAAPVRARARARRAAAGDRGRRARAARRDDHRRPHRRPSSARSARVL